MYNAIRAQTYTFSGQSSTRLFFPREPILHICTLSLK